MPPRRRGPRGTPPVLVHLPATETTCDGCGAPVWRGMNDKVCAELVTADPPLGRVGEPGVLLRAVVALLSGRTVVTLTETTRRLDRCDRLRLAGLARSESGRIRPRLLLSHLCPARTSTPTERNAR